MTVDQKRTEWTDKTGTPLGISQGTLEDRPSLMEMYDAFTLKGLYQGLPPTDPEIRGHWVTHLLCTADNFLAWHGSKVIGHAALMLGKERNDAEFVIFIHSSYRNRGLGKKLTSMAVEKARELGLKAVWLTVEAFNFRAVSVYRKCGFVFLDTGEPERQMRIEM